jgi:hypothetical protein
MHRPVLVTHSSFREGLHTTKNLWNPVSDWPYSLEKFGSDKRSSLLQRNVSDDEKKFINTDTWNGLRFDDGLCMTLARLRSISETI